MPKHFDLIVFDWDGTLVDSTQLIVDSVIAASIDVGLNMPAPSAVRSIIGLGLHEALVELFGSISEAQLQQMVARYRFHYFTEDHRVPLFEGVFEAIIELEKQGFMLAVATGKGRRGLNQSLERSGLLKYFHATRCVDECNSKPHPQMLLELMGELDTEPARTLMIGDTIHDLQMAQNANVARVAVTYGAQPIENLLPCAPLAYFDNFTKLNQWLIMNA